MVCHHSGELVVVRAIVADQVQLMRTLGVFANKSLSSFDRSRGVTMPAPKLLECGRRRPVEGRVFLCGGAAKLEMTTPDL